MSDTEIATATEGLYLDDLHVGQCFTSHKHVVSEKQINAFAREFDPQPFFVRARVFLSHKEFGCDLALPRARLRCRKLAIGWLAHKSSLRCG